MSEKKKKLVNKEVHNAYSM